MEREAAPLPTFSYFAGAQRAHGGTGLRNGNVTKKQETGGGLAEDDI